MFIIVVASARVEVITLAVIVAVISAGVELCLLFGILSFSISVFNGLTVLVPDKLSKSRFKILDEGMSDKTLVGLHLVVGELTDLIMGFNVILN